MIISRSIHIAAPVDRVFALITDFEARARLNPGITPIQVELESGKILQVGTICHFRMKIDGRIVDYRTRITEFVPGRRAVSVSDTAVPFELTLETEPENGGTRLTHSERFDPTDVMLLEAAPPGGTSRFLQLLDRMLPFLDLDMAGRLHAEREEVLRDKLEGNLDRWLAAIRRHLEAPPG
jgi:carbon monoxide dehydrogenase subunit G